MHFIFILLVVIIGSTFVGFAFFYAFRSPTHNRGRKWLQVTGGLLLAFGGLGFFGSALSASGGLGWLPPTFEWPVGYAKNVLLMPVHRYAVPLTASGRIQIYDMNWGYLRGWSVDANGGTFVLRPEGRDRIEVITARGNLRYLYDLDGTMLSKGTYAPENYGDYPSSGGAYSVPTKWWLLPFTGPFYSWILGVLGGALLFGAEKWKVSPRKERQSGER